MSNVKYPLKVGPNRRYLVDQNDVPFLLQGDAGWSLVVGATREEAERYLKDRRQKGFNTIMVNIIEHMFCRNPPKNAYGEEPFTERGDLSTPNERYFAHADWVVEKAAEYGTQLLWDPIFLGTEENNQGWINEILASGLQKCLEYGRYLGDRYKDFDNIIWHIGGDLNPGPATEHIDMIALGIKEYDERHLFSAQTAPESSAVDIFSSGGWLDINTTYTYAIVHRKLLMDYNRTPTMPFILVESTYEGEHNASQIQIRRQAYWAILCGAFGHIFGNSPIWLFGKGWKEAIEAPGSTGMMHWGRLFRSRKWYDLVPDQKHEVVTAGLGEFFGLDYLSAARTTDGSTVIAYMPTSRTITVDLSKVDGSKVNAWWYNPSNGEATSAGEYPTKRSRKFVPKRDGDWVIVLDDASKDLPPPGKENVWNMI